MGIWLTLNFKKHVSLTKIENQKLLIKLLFVIFHSDLEGGGSCEG
jgi:hypothetical protein